VERQFFSAGFTDFLAQGVDFSLTPDYGVKGEIDAFARRCHRRIAEREERLPGRC
jgi:hypothetical protein